MLVDFKEACQGVTACTFECQISLLCQDFTWKKRQGGHATADFSRQLSDFEISGQVRADKVFGSMTSCEACE